MMGSPVEASTTFPLIWEFPLKENDKSKQQIRSLVIFLV